MAPRQTTGTSLSANSAPPLGPPQDVTTELHLTSDRLKTTVTKLLIHIYVILKYVIEEFRYICNNMYFSIKLNI